MLLYLFSHFRITDVSFIFIYPVHWTRKAYYVLILYLGMKAHKGIAIIEYLRVNKEKYMHEQCINIHTHYGVV